MNITLSQFIASKPKHVRLGQWFVVCYCKAVMSNAGPHWEQDVDALWGLDGQKAIAVIEELLDKWQWKGRLPPVREHQFTQNA
jgi:hypothetical protein